MSIFTNVVRYVRSLPLQYSVGGGVLIVIVLVVGVHLITGSAATPVTPPQISHVTLASVASLSSQAGPLPVVGTVTSLNQASILAESSGEITLLNHQLGDQVSAGSIIAEMENSSQQAAVVQAQGAYEGAQAALTKAQGSTAANSSITSTQAAGAAANAQTSVTASLHSAFAAADDAVHTKADALFNNPRSTSPTLVSFTIPDSQLVTTVENERSTLDPLIASMQTLGSATSTADIDASVTAAISNAQTIESFLNDLITAINEAVPNQYETSAQIASSQATLSAARSEVVGAVSSLTASKSAYDSAVSGAQTATNSATAGTGSDIATAEANAKSALGALQAAEANLEKTIIRSPISGTIVSLPITQGGFVSSFAQVAQVSNPGALEIDTYVTADDAKTIAVGGKAVISGTVQGVIVSIAPAIDPTTGKILVKVGLVGSQSQLTDGDTVTLTLARAVSAPSTTAASASSASLVIPIVAAKITPTGPVVFTVSSSTLVSMPITLGTILGDQVTVLSGLTPQSDIVTDARGLSNGQQVVVDTQ
ncbi:MAG TPA: HlyD family efflux transporter periplasmic adaptor subunit [Candidatus Paceibacterota bacterium]|nr:HlyD family efflux transporter periplasmic adaptor subunit [Candidatus Paceibacterota bacterium]